jgi:hypothetical protein
MKASASSPCQLIRRHRSPHQLPRSSSRRKSTSVSTLRRRFQVAKTEFGELNIQVFSCVRNLNQSGLDRKSRIRRILQ